MELQRVNDSSKKLEYNDSSLRVGNERRSYISLPTKEIMSLKGILHTFIALLELSMLFD